MSPLVRLLLTDTWWTYNASGGWFTHVYSWFNVVEGWIWIVFAALVLRRYLKCRRSPSELAYAAAFFTFGLSDFRESYALESWLVLFKAVNLAALLILRWNVLRRLYPEYKLF
ncbi:MAG TPA: hypothetical protein VFB96_20335 [Pirellulaceae bacterium]|nr:hypothetical protein [Pirellulaceae bacterium]